MEDDRLAVLHANLSQLGGTGVGVDVKRRRAQRTFRVQTAVTSNGSDQELNVTLRNCTLWVPYLFCPSHVILVAFVCHSAALYAWV
jgi:hypothetical protein